MRGRRIVRLKRRFRLTRSTDIQRVRRTGKSHAHPLIVLVDLPGQPPEVRVSVIAGRSVGKAVARNRAKRLLRAALSPYLAQISPGREMLLIARSRMAEANFQQTQAAVLTLLRRARVLVKANDNSEKKQATDPG